MDISEAKNIIKQRFPDAEFEIISFTGFKTKPITIKCLKCGQIITYSSLTDKLRPRVKNFCTNCVQQDNNRSFEERLQKQFPNESITILKFVSGNDYIKYSCNKCGATYEKTRASHLFDNKYLCANCTNAVYEGTIKHKLDYLLKEQSFILLDEYKDINSKLKIKCTKCSNIFERNAHNFVSSPRCPFCEVDDWNIGKRQEQIEEEFGKGVFTIIPDANNARKIFIKHIQCGFVFEVHKLSSFLKSRGCPHCHKSMSKGEKSIMTFLDNHKIEYIHQYSVDINNQRHIFDFKININNKVYIVEFNGEQHYKPIDIWGGQLGYETRVKRDKEKEIFCKEKGYDFITIPYTDFPNINNILVQRLGLQVE